MKKTKNKNEEIQARRGFFKGSSKGVMPVISLLDVAVSAKLFGGDSECSGCYGSCLTTCTSCQNTCSGSCEGSARKTTLY